MASSMAEVGNDYIDKFKFSEQSRISRWQTTLLDHIMILQMAPMKGPYREVGVDTQGEVDEVLKEETP